MKKTLRTLNIIGFIVMVSVNTVVGYFGVSGNTVRGVSEKYSNLFTPAGFTFLIWGLIYLALLLFVIYQLSRGAEKTVSMIGILFFVSTILNTGWIFAWVYEQIGLSLVLITILFFMLMAIYIKINKERYGTSVFFVRFPFNLYFAWICTALVANFSVFLKSSGWDMFGVGEEIWMLNALFILLMATSLVTLIKKDPVFGAVTIWSVTGILIRQLDEFGHDYPFTIAMIVLIYVVVVIENIYNLYKAMTK